MAGGLLALLDDITALVKVTAATLDDIPAQVAKASAKVSGVVIDDTAVTPKYVIGLDPSRELAIIYRIARSSVFNKLVFLAPAVLVLGYFAPWAITPLLMLGGSYLCYEGYEKVHHMVTHKAHAPEAVVQATPISPDQLEKERIRGAVKTDFILSAEIVAIAYATVAHQPLLAQIIVLACTCVAITVGVYGFVGVIVKADDVGVYLAKRSRFKAIRTLGRGLVKAMPYFLSVLGYVGTFAMLWVGTEIIVHGIPVANRLLAHLEEALAGMALLGWLAKVGVCVLGGLAVGALIDTLVGAVRRVRHAAP